MNNNASYVVKIDKIIFKGKREEWKKVEKYLKKYIGNKYIIESTNEKIYISSDFPDEFSNSESRIMLRGGLAKAKANISQVIPSLVSKAEFYSFEENNKHKHKNDACNGWYRYRVYFAIPIFGNDGCTICRYNTYTCIMLVRCSENEMKYLCDFISIKKETSSPFESDDCTV